MASIITSSSSKMATKIAVILAPLVGLSLAFPGHPDSDDSAPDCFDFFAKVPVTAPSYPPLIPAFTNGYEAVEALLQSQGTRDAAGDLTQLLGPKKSITKTFTISATYCTPSSKSSKSSITQVLTHGLGFDKR